MKRTRNLTCKNKEKHYSKESAEDAMYSFARRNFGGIRMNTEVYKCGDHYHWGHYRNRKH